MSTLSALRSQPAEEKAIGIVGGVGPAAGTHFQSLINRAVPQVSRDQDNPTIFHISAPAGIADRTRFLKGEIQENPAQGALEVIEMLELLSREKIKRTIVAGVPCNTFHAPPIFGELQRLMQEAGIENVQVLHMIDEVVSSIAREYPTLKKIGLLSTTGTRQQRIYHDRLETAGLSVIEVAEPVQDDLHETIYHPEWGIKAVSNPVSETALRRFESYADHLIEQGAEAIILGCTEIPLALSGTHYKDTPLIDPMEALAQALVRHALPSRF